jgi:hypothetical protein
MRLTIVVFAAIQFAVVPLATAQTVIDVEGQKASSPQLQDQGQVQTQQNESSQLTAPSHYSFIRVNNGFVRIDNESGQVAYCSPLGEGWRCEGVADRSALETEIASLQKQMSLLRKLDMEVGQLRDEISSLKKEIVGLKQPTAARSPADHTRSNGSDVSVKLPTHQDIMRARDYLEETWRRLVEIIVSVQKDIMRRS